MPRFVLYEGDGVVWDSVRKEVADPWSSPRVWAAHDWISVLADFGKMAAYGLEHGTFEVEWEPSELITDHPAPLCRIRHYIVLDDVHAVEFALLFNMTAAPDA